MVHKKEMWEIKLDSVLEKGRESNARVQHSGVLISKGFYFLEKQ